MQFLASDPCVTGAKINTKIASQERVMVPKVSKSVACTSVP